MVIIGTIRPIKELHIRNRKRSWGEFFHHAIDISQDRANDKIKTSTANDFVETDGFVEP